MGVLRLPTKITTCLENLQRQTYPSSAFLSAILTRHKVETVSSPVKIVYREACGILSSRENSFASAPIPV